LLWLFFGDAFQDDLGKALKLLGQKFRVRALVALQQGVQFLPGFGVLFLLVVDKGNFVLRGANPVAACRVPFKKGLVIALRRIW